VGKPATLPVMSCRVSPGSEEALRTSSRCMLPSRRAARLDDPPEDRVAA
jgi:hypothetical protein